MLAWIRTGLALMGFGFVVSKFGLFLRRLEELETGRIVPAAHGTVASLWIGVVLVAVGVVVSVAAAVRYRRLVVRLRGGEVRPPTSPALAFYLALTLAAIGIGIAIYLATLRA